MRPTRFGIQGLVLYVALLSAFYAFPYSNLFFLLLGFLTLLGAFGAWAALRNVAGLAASVDRDLDPVPSGVEHGVPVRIDATRGRHFMVTVRLELDSGEEILARASSVGRGADEAITARTPALTRGRHRISRAMLESTHPFGIVRVTRPVDAPAELLAYPRPHGLQESRSRRELQDELLGLGEVGEGDLQPLGLRDHRDGEGLRGVHWRASARRGRLVVQEWVGASGQSMEVSLDRRCAPEALEEALATISALAELGRESKETLRVSSQDLAVTFGEGQRPWSELLRFLALAETLPSDAPAPPTVSPSVARLPRRSSAGEHTRRVAS